MRNIFPALDDTRENKKWPMFGFTDPQAFIFRPVCALFCSILALMLSGCSTTAAIPEVHLPLASIRDVVKQAIYGTVRKESENQREIFSTYFRPDNPDVPAETDRVRAYAHVTILGDRRPFAIDIKVIREVRDRSDGRTVYRPAGSERRLTERLIAAIKQGLINRPADRNVIDDFKAF